MGLTSSLYTGMSGLTANQERIDTIGNNIANVNTTAFKGSRTLFQTQFYETYSTGTRPSDVTGGVNPMQVGHGVLVGTTQRNLSGGPIETTGLTSDLAIDGNGFFMVRTGDNEISYTRDGAFTLDSNNQLVSIDGYNVRGYGVDAEHNVDPTGLVDIVIPLGTTTTAHSTTDVSLDGDLSAAGTIATTSSESISQKMVSSAGDATADTALTDLRSANDEASVLFAAGDTITISGATKGGREVGDATFVVGTDGNTLGDFATWLENTLGIQTSDGLPGEPGVTIEEGALVIRGNAGEPNSITISSNDIVSTNETAALPFQFSQNAESDGSGVYTGFTVYDSLGTPVQVQVTFTLEETPDQGPVWRFYVESADASGPTGALGTGTVAFDNDGNVREVTGDQVTLSRADTGAATPLTFALDFASIHGLSTASSSVIMSEQNGYPPGTLSGYSIGDDGLIEGTYTNGLSETLGQIALAVFPNAEGLVALNDNLFASGANSGEMTVTLPGEFGSGTIHSGALEMSNVDLSEQFIGLVGASTGFQASSRVITVSSDMLDQLLLLIR
ncbi:MAG: flagellar hook-basal body complex protein [Phycisphaerae bacterium]|nr:flagellar hook-basal body complex protein [Phycisphaerae bacterium]